jgi:hypothetical protein
MLGRSPLRSLHDLGAALGEYQWKLLPLQPITYEERHLDLWPDVGSIASALRSLPAIITNQVPLLGSLKELAPERDMPDRAEYLNRFLDRVKDHLRLDLSQDEIDFRRDGPKGRLEEYRLDLFYRIYVHILRML